MVGLGSQQVPVANRLPSQGMREFFLIACLEPRRSYLLYFTRVGVWRSG